MGIITSKDTRRISFDNTYALPSAIVIQKSFVDNGILANVDKPQDNKLFYHDLKNTTDIEEVSEMDYWVHRIENLKKEHQSINQILESEYEKTLEYSKTYFETPEVTKERIQKIKPCFEWRAKILKCYQDNPHQPLMCSAAVKALSKCVASCRNDDLD